MTRLDILFVPEADPGQRRLEGGMLGRVDFSVTPCKQCDSRCCQLRAFLSVPEALRIVGLLGVPFAEFIGIEVEGENVVLDTRWGHALKTDEGKAQLTLMRGENGYCRHIMRPGERTSHCGIYSLRPAVCRLFPFTFKDLDDAAGGLIAVGNQNKCPTKWLMNDELRADVERAYDAWLVDLALDKKLVARWNRKKGDKSVAALRTWLCGPLAEELGYHPADLHPFPERQYGLFRQLKNLRAMKADSEP